MKGARDPMAARNGQPSEAMVAHAIWDVLRVLPRLIRARATLISFPYRFAGVSCRGRAMASIKLSERFSDRCDRDRAAIDQFNYEIGDQQGPTLEPPPTDAKLWPDGTPDWASGAWGEFRDLLIAAGDDWDVWVSWYEDRLTGRPSLTEGFDIAVATLPDELWQQGPSAVNARIKALIADHAPADTIPAQGAGPRFALSRDLKIALASAGDFDAHGNNVSRIRQLLPVLRQAISDLAGHLNPNTSRSCSGRQQLPRRYCWRLRSDRLGRCFGLGVRLENAMTVARREIANRLQEPLEDAAQEAIDSALTLHGSLILATAEGRELSEGPTAFVSAGNIRHPCAKTLLRSSR